MVHFEAFKKYIKLSEYQPLRTLHRNKSLMKDYSKVMQKLDQVMWDYDLLRDRSRALSHYFYTKPLLSLNLQGRVHVWGFIVNGNRYVLSNSLISGIRIEFETRLTEAQVCRDVQELRKFIVTRGFYPFNQKVKRRVVR